MKRSTFTDAVWRLHEHRRKGVFFVLAIVSLMAAMTFVGMSVDLGMITVTKTRMQSAADAAALAAVQEIVVGIREAGEQGVTELQAVQAIAAAAARDMAEDVVTMNGFYIDPNRDVTLGHRTLSSDGVTYTEVWGAPPYNMVKVTIRKTNSDPAAQDAKLPLIFAPVTGERAQALSADATAFIESRDIVAVLDYSGSMAFDSQFRSDTVNRLGKTAVEDGLDEIWDALVDSGVTYSDDPTTPKFPPSGFGLINSYEGIHISGTDTDEIFEALGLHNGGLIDDVNGLLVTGADTISGCDAYIEVTFFSSSIAVESTKDLSNVVLQYADGTQQKFEPLSGRTGTFAGTGSNTGKQIVTAWIKSGCNASGDGPGFGERFDAGSYVPFPQEGKSNNGRLKGKPSRSESETLWKSYIQYTARNLDRWGYEKRYGYRTLVNYLISNRKSNSQSEDLWRSPIYPHHAMKEGMTMLTRFLDNLGYGDHLGLVTYATTSRIETGIDDDGADTHVNLNGDHLTDQVMDIDTIQRQKQPGHYNSSTGIGYGIEDARDLLDDQGRYGAQKAILLMTDGQSNRYPSGFGTGSLPSGWNWDDITDFDGDASADLVIDGSYRSGGNGDGNWRAALHTFVRAKEAHDAGYTIHTISIGDGADTTLMQGIADMSGGEYVHVASGTSNTAMEEQLEAAFAILAGRVPPAKLIVED